MEISRISSLISMNDQCLKDVEEFLIPFTDSALIISVNETDALPFKNINRVSRLLIIVSGESLGRISKMVPEIDRILDDSYSDNYLMTGQSAGESGILIVAELL